MILENDDCISIAEALYLAGFEPYYSHNIADQLICGYGKLDGDFQYPLVLDQDNKVVINFQKVK